MPIRLNKFLSQQGIASRREADRLIQAGRVAVNEQAVQDLGLKIDPDRDRVIVDGKKVKPRRAPVYILLNKPRGFLVTMSDPFERPTIRNLIPSLPDGVHPVGRLDKDSEGLLLLTNDGELAFRLTHPRYKVPKVYAVRLKGEVSAAERAKLKKGVFASGRRTAPDGITTLGADSKNSLLLVKIHEGRKREVRRMFESIGHEVARLRRVSFAGLKLEHLPSGKWRFLKKEEVLKLRHVAGLT